MPITAAVAKAADTANCKGVPGSSNRPNGCVGTRSKDAEEPEGGTYTYFCRVHPFMRGAFRVVKKKA